MPKIEVLQERCKGCLLCAQFCPKQNIEPSGQLNAKGYFSARMIDEKNCTGCKICAIMCPDVAIEVYK
jgi:2-oxoglutarate ferredoxin oxidoreductase subunit delta